ncbi:hypothetical protein [Thiomicrorhabdus cannonii]|uniref:hypothetical protein n=1 Tax=Thiomicrorhabdus cannonii TaxID=2748011 RepID=UPI0015B9B4CE|nr:hypothetical protein [Thiomicrorhabdus cannonii]
MSDSIAIAKRLHWKNAFIFGAVAFAILYFVVPWMLPEPQASSAALQPMMDRAMHRGQWVFEKLGIGILIVCWFFGAVGYVKERWQ